MRVATVDVGSHTALLLVADVRGEHLEPVVDRLAFTRLGAGVDASGAISGEAVRRLVEVLRGFREEARAHGVDRLDAAATSAMRDASNRDEIIRRLAAEGVDVTVLSGEDEASWTLRGVLGGLSKGHPQRWGAGGSPAYYMATPSRTGDAGGDAGAPGMDEQRQPLSGRGPATVVDVGGGSTEIVSGDRDGLGYRVSVDVGSTRLRERFWPALPPTPEQEEALRRGAREAFATAEVPRDLPRPVVGVAGTVATLAGLEHGVHDLDAGALDGRVLTAEALHRWSRHLARLTEEETLALAPSLLQGRAHLVAAGAAILDAACHAAGWEEVVFSPRGLRHGWALRCAGRRPGRTADVTGG